MPEYTLIRVDMSKHFSFDVKGIALKVAGEYYIAIDQSLSGDQLDMVYKHELSHILLGHLDRDIETAVKEREADEYAARMTDQEYKKLQEMAKTTLAQGGNPCDNVNVVKKRQNKSL